MDRALVIPASDDRRVALGHAAVTILAGAAETGGASAVLDYRMPGGYAGPPAHVHPGFDEIFSVIEGRLTVRLGDETHVAGPGDTVVVPGVVAHTFANLAPEPARVLIVLTPGGFESYFAELAPLLGEGPPDFDAIGALAARYGVTSVGPPIAPMSPRQRLEQAALVGAMVVAGLNVWTGVPLLGLWVGSRVVGDSGTISMPAVFVTFLTMGAAGWLVVRTLALLDARHRRLTGHDRQVRRHVPWLRSMRGERPHDAESSASQMLPLDYVLVATVVVAVAAFEIWFFFFSSSPIDQRSGRH